MPPGTEEPPRGNRGPAAGPANRRALLDAAREVYAEQGLSVPFSAVARRAGVGQGSLYRHFATPVALAAAVFEDNVAALEEIADAPGARLRDLFDAIVAQATAATALIELTTSHRADPDVVHLGVRFQALVERMLEREHASGRVGAHVEAADVLLAVGMVATELARTDPAHRADVAERSRRIFRRAFAP